MSRQNAVKNVNKNTSSAQVRTEVTSGLVLEEDGG
jgi:hypothetical protein